MSHLKLPPYQKSQRKSYAGFTSAQRQAASPNTSTFTSSFQLVVTAPISSMNNLSTMSSCDKIPSGFVPMDNQVAGHTFHVGSDEIGMLKSVDDGSVLKPGGSPMCAAREIKFYEQLLTSNDSNVQRLKEFTSEYRGVETLTVGNKTIKFIKLRDLTHGMHEPCVIDLKMGRRTYDPLATEDKKRSEDGKYVQCKTTVGFCIPGFQTYQISSGNYKKFGKEYGKKLNENTVVDALRLFLNADSGLSRQLITSILTSLWAIQSWMRTQTSYKFYSSSILIAYDGRKLRQLLELQKRQNLTANAMEPSNGNKSSSNSRSPSPLEFIKKTEAEDIPATVYKKIQRSHSSNNDYDQEMRNMKNDYQQMLDNLVVGAYDEKKEWIHVKMIDFAHTFTNAELSDGQASSLDLNYLNGIENLVKMFEDLLKTCDSN